MKEVIKMSKLLYALTVAACALALRGLLIMLLWNWVIVGLFGASTISYLLAVGAGIVLDFVGGFFKKRG